MAEKIDMPRACGIGKLGGVDANSGQQALESVDGAGGDRDLGHAGVLAIVVAVGDVLRQAQQGCWRSVCNYIVCTLVGHHRGGYGHLAPPLSQLHDQLEIDPPGHVVEYETPIGSGERGRNGLPRHLGVASGATRSRTCRNRIQRSVRYRDDYVIERVQTRRVVHGAADAGCGSPGAADLLQTQVATAADMG